MALSHTPHTVSVIDNSAPSEPEARENEKLLQVCHNWAPTNRCMFVLMVQRQLLSLCWNKQRELQYMRDQHLYETPDEFQHRVDVLQLLLELVPQWVQTVAEHLGRSEAEIEAAHGFVFSYGSFRLSTHGPGASLSLCTQQQQW